MKNVANLLFLCKSPTWTETNPQHDLQTTITRRVLQNDSFARRNTMEIRYISPDFQMKTSSFISSIAFSSSLCDYWLAGRSVTGRVDLHVKSARCCSEIRERGVNALRATLIRDTVYEKEAAQKKKFNCKIKMWPAAYRRKLSWGRGASSFVWNFYCATLLTFHGRIAFIEHRSIIACRII